LTLVELLSCIVVLSVMGSTAAFVLFTAVDSYVEAAVTSQLHAEASIALDRIGRAFNAIELDTGAAGVAPDITSVTPTSIEWGAGSSVSLSGDRVMITIEGQPVGGAVLLNDVSSFSIQTANESNAALGGTLSGAACDPIRRIAVSVTLSRHGVSHTLAGRFFIRATMQGPGGSP
jgi:type II secretory pathway pseudopilin PulG